MVAGARFAPDRERLTVWSLEDAFQAARRALFHNVDKSTAGGGGHFGREQACALP